MTFDRKQFAMRFPTVSPRAKHLLFKTKMSTDIFRIVLSFPSFWLRHFKGGKTPFDLSSHAKALNSGSYSTTLFFVQLLLIVFLFL